MPFTSDSASEARKLGGGRAKGQLGELNRLRLKAREQFVQKAHDVFGKLWEVYLEKALQGDQRAIEFIFEKVLGKMNGSDLESVLDGEYGEGLKEIVIKYGKPKEPDAV